MNKTQNYDLATDMVKHLQATEHEGKFHTNKVELALACLNKAAELLDNMNAFGASEIVTRVIERVASRRSDVLKKI